jgi:hypothetical protein
MDVSLLRESDAVGMPVIELFRDLLKTSDVLSFDHNTFQLLHLENFSDALLEGCIIDTANRPARGWQFPFWVWRMPESELM